MEPFADMFWGLAAAELKHQQAAQAAADLQQAAQAAADHQQAAAEMEEEEDMGPAFVVDTDWNLDGGLASAGSAESSAGPTPEPSPRRSPRNHPNFWEQKGTV